MAIRTLIDIFDMLAANPRPDQMRFKSGEAFTDIPTGTIVRRVRSLAACLMERGVGPGDRVALLSENRPEWAIGDFAILNAGAVTVPIYATLLTEQIGYIIRDCGAKVALVSTPDQYEKIRQLIDVTDLETVIGFDTPHLPGPWMLPLTEAYRLGEEADRRDPSKLDARRALARPETLSSVIYTSGTTGDPKGVMLTHENFVSNIETVLQLIPVEREDVGLSFLPLSHVLERTAEYAFYRRGCSVAYAESLDKLAQNLTEVRPTLTAAVPRVFEKFRGRVLEAVRTGPPLKRKMFHWALETGKKRIRYTLADEPVPGMLAMKYHLADRLVFSKVKARLGGRLRFFISGGAPLSRDLAEFFFAAGITIIEGYGLTETSPVIAINRLDRLRLGTVGPVIPGVDVSFGDDGEILVRGPNVMKGYWNKPEETAAVMEGGWFHTGDIGYLDKDGFLVITDRKKDLLVTSAGKNIAPQPLENAIKTSRFIANVVCIGDKRHYVTALVVPDFEALTAWAREHGLVSGEPADDAGTTTPPATAADAGPIRDLLARREVIDLFGREIERTTERFAPYERVKKFDLLEKDFTLEAGEITPTLKVKRRVIIEKYADRIERLYASGKPAPDRQHA